MKKYARLRQECSEFDNALYDATPEGSGRRSRAGGDGSFRIVAGELGLAGALKKLGSFREAAAVAARPTQQQASPCSEVASESGRWANNAETASLSGRWGSVSCTTDEAATRNASFRDSLSLSRSGRLVQEGEPWKAAAPSEPTSRPTMISPPTATAAAAPQGWLASVKRPLQPRKRATHHSAGSDDDDPHEFNWRAATSSSTNPTSSTKSPPCATISQSMRYDRLKTIDLIDADDAFRSSQSVMQKAASMREGCAHSDAIMAMAKAYSEKHGVAQAILACAACGRSLGVVVQGNPANGDTSSFCQTCRPHVLGNWDYNQLAAKAAPPPEAVKSKRKGMIHFCKKILRMGKKPNKSRS